MTAAPSPSYPNRNPNPNQASCASEVILTLTLTVTLTVTLTLTLWSRNSDPNRNPNPNLVVEEELREQAQVLGVLPLNLRVHLEDRDLVLPVDLVAGRVEQLALRLPRQAAPGGLRACRGRGSRAGTTPTPRTHPPHP